MTTTTTPSPAARLHVIRAAHGVMYAIAMVAGIYGFVQPRSAVSTFYGVDANALLVILITLGGAVGTYAYAMDLAWLEMVGIPFLAVPVTMITPAVFYGDISAHQTAWTGWLCLVLVSALVSRWLDVRALRAAHAARARHRKG